MTSKYEIFKLVRQYHGLTETQLAYQIGIETDLILRVEAGLERPTVTLAGKYAERFELPVDTFVFFFADTDSAPTGAIRSFVATQAIRLLRWGIKDDGIFR